MKETKPSKNQLLFKIRFVEKDIKEPIELVVKYVSPSEFIGLVKLSGLVFEDQRKYVILPEEDQARKRFAKTETLHIPYHNILYIEEFLNEPTDLKKLPFVKDVELKSEKD